MHSVNFRKGANHAGLFDNVGDPGYHFSDHASWGKQFGYWLENNFGQYGEFGPKKGSTAEVVGQEIGAVVYAAHPLTFIPELILGTEGPQTQTVAGTGASYAMMLVTPGGAAKGSGKAASGVIQYSDDLVNSARQAYPKLAGKVQNHHITPKYLGGARNGPTVPLDGAYHQKITNAFRERWGYGQGPIQNEQFRREVLDAVYKEFPLPSGYTY
jgi:hypothetical protein